MLFPGPRSHLLVGWTPQRVTLITPHTPSVQQFAVDGCQLRYSCRCEAASGGRPYTKRGMRQQYKDQPHMTPPRPIRKLLVANRSEIATRVFRSAHELGVRTVPNDSHEDRFALHRFKADEAYRVGRPGEPIRSYLDVDGIVRLAVQHGIDAIHPGYGFLSENPLFARAI